MISMKTINKVELEKIYLEILPQHFPQNEIKPWAKVSKLWDMGGYHGYQWEADNQIIGYALLFQAEDGYWLLDYYAVMEDKRNQGYGGKFLQQIKAALTDFAGIIIEAENPDFACDEADQELRKRRINFYLRNGCVQTQVLAYAAGVEYVVVYMPCQKEADTVDIAQHLDDIYHKILRAGDLVKVRFA